MLFGISENLADLEIIENRVKDSAKIKGTNFLLLLLAVLIASVGLNINSVPVIIGAMLISPLMGPIIGIGYYTARNDFDNLRYSIGGYFQFLILSVILSTIYFWLSPIDVATQEILNRVNPTIWDALIAFAGGLAGVVAITRKEFNNIFPGVAIATSLMPPLCTMGYGLAHADLNMAINAFYLFFINSFFIALTTLLVMNVIHVPEVKLDKKTKMRHYMIIISVVSILLIPSVIKGKEIIEQEVFEVQTKKIVGILKDNGVVVLSEDSNKQYKTLNLVVLEAANMSSINLEEFTKKYKLKIDTVKTSQNINFEELKGNILSEIKKEDLEKVDFHSLIDDLIFLNKNIKDIAISSNNKTVYVLINKKDKEMESIVENFIKIKTKERLKVKFIKF